MVCIPSIAVQCKFDEFSLSKKEIIFLYGRIEGDSVFGPPATILMLEASEAVLTVSPGIALLLVTV